MSSNILSTVGALNVKYTTTGAVTTGDLLVVNDVVMVALQTAVTGDVITCQVGGAATLPKAAADSFSAFDAAYVTTSTGGVNSIASTATGNKLTGFVLADAATGATKLTVNVQLVAGPSV